MRKILIAHQSSIPHYRVSFYNYLHDQLSPDFRISVVRDSSSARDGFFFKERIDYSDIQFDIHYTRTIFFTRSKKYCFQTFLFSAWKYDLIIAENAINNLSYPFLILYKLFGKKVAFWGHGRDLNNPNDTSFKRKLIESLKIRLVRLGNGFFAYTKSVKSYLKSKGIKSKSIYNVENTIDINNARRCYESVEKGQVGIKKRLVFTGRLTKSKRIDFLLSAFEEIIKTDPSFELVIIGGGSSEIEMKIHDLSSTLPIKFLGTVTDNYKLAEIYKECDLYIYPGYIGLGVLHAMCFDLVPVVIDSEFHKPEFDYLNEGNSIILPSSTHEKSYAESIVHLYQDPSRLVALKENVWNTISPLTIENMVDRFADGIKKILNK